MSIYDHDAEDILSESLEFLGGQPVIDDSLIRYGPLVLSLPPKVQSALSVVSIPDVRSSTLYLAERIERGLLDVRGKTVIELGAGSALPSLLLSSRPEPPSLIVITDYPDEGIMGNLRKNVDRNAAVVSEGCSVKCEGYDWGKDPQRLLDMVNRHSPGYDIVLLSDLVHFFDSHDALISSVTMLLRKQKEARVYVGAGKYTRPEVCDNFLLKSQSAGLELEEIYDDADGKWLGSLQVGNLDNEALALRKSNCRFWIGMGISGLLPALKSIQVTKHLSEFRGKTVAVDAYVWLHKGVYSCAVELARGKDTHKYVDYAMHRIRLLRHHKIEPYVVFDGGPLPAKKGTEAERKQKREESLAKGKALLAQGKHSQARDCFVKCVDVTPQMAYQFIKALRAESVPYVVAPYEADAQLAYLERSGIADAILTEDSDLLVFGCQNVLFKLDTVAATVVSISRKDFGSVAASSSDANGISLIGWSDVQFRAMTILSGCDYLPSIPGIGLKTACQLLKKWKTAEQVIKIIAMEGKKAVPSGYLKQFRLAEKCFQHQRVYCPMAERLVHLTEIDSDWNEEFDAYVGRYVRFRSYGNPLC
ncbi:hypothetical protein CVT26_009501 [Gymnopilus dilepis]|uniref:Uncharacterized protein n=1 Tax=Gymnopilus dilepis TaxID=231916 RepID=A0A409VJU9_9AGAR|nr:hypothetical protein CVT26_009501 [Gymnopilus dilepis]